MKCCQSQYEKKDVIGLLGTMKYNSEWLKTLFIDDTKKIMTNYKLSKKLALCNKLKFYNLYVFATW